MKEFKVISLKKFEFNSRVGVSVGPGCFFLFSLMMIVTSSSCSSDGSQANASTIPRSSTPDFVSVEIVRSGYSAFDFQIVSNGKVFGTDVQLVFKSNGILSSVDVGNGTVVKENQLLAVLENERQRLALKEAQISLEESRVELNDILISMGGKRGDSTTVSGDKYSYALIKSGYSRAIIGLRKAELDLKGTFLYAPCSGTISNLDLSNFNSVIQGQHFCTLVNRSRFVTKCNILESELANVDIGQKARIEPVGIQGSAYTGRVSSINQSVDAQGLIGVQIDITNADRRLLSGMNVNVIIQRIITNQIVVPKEAIVERSGRKILFTYDKGVAKWHEVQVGGENNTNVIITKGLLAGEEVIIKGNLNLAHDSKVKKK